MQSAQTVMVSRQNTFVYDEGASEPTLYNYFRDYDPSTGRYIESDPIGLRGGLNRFVYAGGNPVSRIDPYGLWSPDAHDALIQYAFDGLLPQSEIDRMKQAGRDFDSSSQGSGDSYKHSMRNSSESPEAAAAKRDQFECEMINQARNSKNRNDALDALAKAMHPMMDKYSPEHTDANGNPKKWNPLWPFGHSPNEHFGNETVKDLTPDIYQNTTRDLIDAYNKAF